MVYVFSIAVTPGSNFCQYVKYVGMVEILEYSTQNLHDNHNFNKLAWKQIYVGDDLFYVSPVVVVYLSAGSNQISPVT